MTTRILDSTQDKRLQPATHLWRDYDPAAADFAFTADTPRQARRWQKRTRRELLATIGFQDLPRPELKPKHVERVDRGFYVREKILLNTSDHISMPVYLLLPKDPPQPPPTVLALHGHGYGVKDIVGLWENGEERGTPDGYHRDFAVELCRRGFAVAAPEISCFGERQTDFSHLEQGAPGQPVPTTCTHTAMLAFHLGRSVVGLRVFDAMRLVDYLETRGDMDASRLGAMGISGGGMHTFFSTCCDERIKACVVSGYYSTFKDSILAMNHCACNFVPGLHRFGEMYDLVGLIAPRPLLVEAGDYDPIFPIKAVKRSIVRARRVYDVFGAKNKVVTDYFEGRHRISGAKAYDFLGEELGL